VLSVLREVDVGVGGLSNTAVSHALKYLRDTLRLLTWKKEWQSKRKRAINRYQLDADAILKRARADESELASHSSPKESELNDVLPSDESEVSSGVGSTEFTEKVPFEVKRRAEDKTVNPTVSPHTSQDQEQERKQRLKALVDRIGHFYPGNKHLAGHNLPPKHQKAIEKAIEEDGEEKVVRGTMAFIFSQKGLPSYMRFTPKAFNFYGPERHYLIERFESGMYGNRIDQMVRDFYNGVPPDYA
jgi:hypothetical protein